MRTKPLRELVAERLAEWMRKTIHLDTQVKLAEACGLGQSSVQRILHAEVNPTVESLEAISLAFDREVVDLCSRDDAANITYDRALYRLLPEYEKARVEGFIKHTIAQHNSGASLIEATPQKAEANPVGKRTARRIPATKKTSRRVKAS